MTRTLDVFLPLPREASDLPGRFLGDPASWLPQPATARDGAWLVEVQAGPIRALVRCEVEAPWPAGEATWRKLRWIPADQAEGRSPRRLLPALDAQLGLAPDNGGSWSLILSGSYDPPAAWLGDVADALLLHRVARSTLHTFLLDVSGRLDARGASA